MPAVVETVVKKVAKMPSYLSELISSTEQIYLVYNKHGSVVNADESLPDILDNSTKLDMSNLDLTGNPLEDDLHEDLQISFTAKASIQLDNWSKEESKFYPLPLQKARDLINEHISNKQNDCGDCQNISIFALCDSSNKDKTIILGNYTSNSEFTQYIVNNIGCFPLDHSAMQVENIIKKHKSMLPGMMTNPIETEVKCLYGIYGHFLQDTNMWDKVENPGCVKVEVSWKNLSYEMPYRIENLKAILQVIVGHPNSPVHSLWEQVLLIKGYMNILETKVFEENVILNMDDDNMDDLEDLGQKIEDILYSSRVMNRFNVKKDEVTLDLHNLRPVNILDQFFTVVSSCKSTEHLKQCFHKLFDEIAQNRDVKFFIPEDNKTGFAKTIRNLYMGTCAVPTLSSKQAMEYLIELGLEKLRQDYFYILHHFKCIEKGDLMQYWYDSVAVEETAQQKRMSMASRRTTRVVRTQQLIATTDICKKLSVLSKMHVIVEFMFMLKEKSMFSEDTMLAITENLIKKHLQQQPQQNVDLNSFESSKIYNFENVLVPNDPIIETLQKDSPSSWKFTLKTPCQNLTSVETIHFISQHPIFPPGLVTDYDHMNECQENVYYNTKLTVLSDNLF